MFLIKLADKLISGLGLRRRECLPANVLDFVFGQVQSGCYGFIGGVLERLCGRLGGSESDHQRGGPKLGLALLVHSFIFHAVNIILIYPDQLGLCDLD